MVNTVNGPAIRMFFNNQCRVLRTPYCVRDRRTNTDFFFSIIIIIIKTFKYRFTNASLNLNKSSIIIYIVVGLECFTADFYDQKYLYLYTLSIINTAADADGIE